MFTYIPHIYKQYCYQAVNEARNVAAGVQNKAEDVRQRLQTRIITIIIDIYYILVSLIIWLFANYTLKRAVFRFICIKCPNIINGRGLNTLEA